MELYYRWYTSGISIFLDVIYSGGALTQLQVLLLLFLTTFGTYVFCLLVAQPKNTKFINDLKVIVAAHIICNCIVAISLVTSIWIEWIRPLVFTEALIILLSWYVLDGCPLTIAEAKLLNNGAAKKLLQNGFLVYYGKSYFGIKLDELKLRKILNYVFYIGIAIVFILWLFYF